MSKLKTLALSAITALAMIFGLSSTATAHDRCATNNPGYDARVTIAERLFPYVRDGATVPVRIAVSGNENDLVLVVINSQSNDLCLWGIRPSDKVCVRSEQGNLYCTEGIHRDGHYHITPDWQ